MRRSNWRTNSSCILLGLLVLPPLIALVVRSVYQAPTSSPPLATFAGKRQLILLGRSLWLALSVGGLATLLGLLAGYAIAAQSRPRQRALLIIMLLPLLIPPFIHALSWIMCGDLLGRSCHGMVPMGASDNVMPGAEWSRLLFLAHALNSPG